MIKMLLSPGIRQISLVIYIFSFILIHHRSNGSSYSASFYGDSFLFERLSDFLTTTTISLQFRTQASNGLVLLAAGQQDYLIISLRDGCIKVQVNVGSGESTIFSPGNQTYNDLLWHQVRLFRVGSRLDLQVNGKNVASGSVPVLNHGPELDVNLGVFLGGYDYNVGASYLAEKVPFFRGCILDATYNSADILDPIYDVAGEKSVHNVDAGCSEIFHWRHEPITFKSNSAYLKFDRWTQGSEGSFEATIKTTASNGLILFNVGWEKEEFVGLEMFGGTIRASVNKGAGVLGLQSTKSVNDGKWHKIRFSFSSSALEIRVDGNRTRVHVEQVERDSSSFSALNDLSLKGPLYVGGVDDETYLVSEHMATGLKFSSFPGCMKHIKVNFRRKTVKSILASHDVQVGCEKVNPIDRNSVPSRPSRILPTFVIVPHKTPVSVNRSQPSNKLDHILSKVAKTLQRKVCYKMLLTELSVTENFAVNITSVNLDVVKMSSVNQKKLRNDNSPSFFTFKLVSRPLHGRLTKLEKLLNVGDVLTLRDLKENRLIYAHDGSESVRDEFTFLIGTEGLDPTIRSMDAKRYALCDDDQQSVSNSTIYAMSIAIAPVDDLPLLHVPFHYVFEPIRNTRTPLPADVIHAEDEDSGDSDIIYHVLGIGAGMYIESSVNPGRPIQGFNQADVIAGLVNLVHAGGPAKTRLLLQVDNDEVSRVSQTSPVVVRVSAKPLTMNVVNNTGVTLVEGEAVVFSNNVLSTSSNAGSSIVDIKYQIIDSPLYGQMQVLLGDDASAGVWSVAAEFFESQLRSKRVRFLNLDTLHETESLIHDRFQFNLIGAGVESGPHTFDIGILRVIVSLHVVPVQLRAGTSSAVLTVDQLNPEVAGLAHVADDEVQIFVAEQLRHGTLFYQDSGVEVIEGDAFTLSELRRGSLRLAIDVDHVDPHVKELRDHVTFYALVQGRYRSSREVLAVTYVPDATIVKITSSTLDVDEGQERLITPDLLFAETILHRRFLFEVSAKPQHGVLRLRNQKDGDASDLVKSSVTSFTTRDIEDGRLYYKHDDSETLTDLFNFSLTPILEGELPEKVTQLSNVTSNGSFHVSITLLNDNPPLRLVNRPFSIARHGSKLLTRNDLWYHDPDVDQDDLDLIYVRRGVSNGDIINATSKRHEPIYEFTQRDIESNSVLIRHRKADFGRFVFRVKDGKHFATGLFTIRASEPYIRLRNTSLVTVEKNSNVTISTGQLEYETNVKGLKRDIKYTVLQAPLYGKLVLTGNRTSTRNFTQQDVDDGRLVYVHDGSELLNDSFKFSVTSGSLSAAGNLSFQVYLASQQQPPVLKRNRAIVVNQSSSALIKRSDLRVSHPAVRPKGLIYLITSPPIYGIVTVDATDRNNPVATQGFSQWDINLGSVRYVQNQNHSFDQHEPFDSFTFDVSNGFTTLTNISTRIEIIPLNIPLRTSNFSVDEGKSRVLIEKYLQIVSRHFDDLDIDLVVVEQPRHGRLESSRSAGVALSKFSWRLAAAEFVYYVHDGGDSLQDSYKLQARSMDTKRTSSVVPTYISINPENDRIPSVVNNTGIKVWVNSSTTVRPEHLAALDLDSVPKDLVFETLPPQNGYLALISDPSVAISNFTQADVNDGNVLFVHRGSKTGGFTFQVNDRLNFDTKHIFVVTATPLVISVSSTVPLQIFPGSAQPIRATNLRSSTNDKEPRDISYVITKPAKFGAIMRRSQPHQDVQVTGNSSGSSVFVEEVTNFTQTDVDSGLLFYRQSRQLLNWNESDDVELTASSGPANDVTNIMLSFNVTFSAYEEAGRNSSIEVNSGLQVLEGSKANLTTAQLDARNLFKKISDREQRNRYILKYRVSRPPGHGELLLNGRALRANNTFVQKALEQHLLVYSHDGSEGIADTFEFEAYLSSKKRSKSRPVSANDTFYIEVQPVNDNPPELHTKSAYLEVVQGFEAGLNRSHLFATDIDDPPSDVQYTMIRMPSYGKLTRRAADVTSTASEPITSFTQAEVDNGTIAYVPNLQSNQVHPDEDQVISDAFYFSLTDGVHRPTFNLFRIKIFPVVVELSMLPINLQQGSFVLTLSRDHIRATTNGHARLLTYTLVQPLLSGSLFVGETEVTSFTDEQLSTDVISYVMSRLDSSDDVLNLTVVYNDTNLSYHPSATAFLRINVTPLVSAGQLNVPTAGRTALTLRHLNASELLSLTGSMPVYTILLRPKHAKITVARDEASSNHTLQRRSVLSTNQFTHDDLASGIVFIDVATINMTNITRLSDSFMYRLSVQDNSVQLAVGKLPFFIVPSILAPQQEPEDVKVTTSGAFVSTGQSEPFSTSPETQTTVPASTTFSELHLSVTSRAATTTVEDLNMMPVKESPDSTTPWLIPLIVSICVVLLLAIALSVFCYVRFRRRKMGPSFVKGHETVLKSPTRRKAHRQQHATIDSHTHVTVTSRSDTLSSAERCPTADVVVTPLRGRPSGEDDEFGSFDDGYMSNSMPAEGVLSSTGTGGGLLMVGDPDISASFRYFAEPGSPNRDIPSRPMLSGAEGADLYSSDESLVSDDDAVEQNFFRSNVSRSMGSLSSPHNMESDEPSPRVNQYWV